MIGLKTMKKEDHKYEILVKLEEIANKQTLALIITLNGRKNW